jgi:hypothetical protein
LFDEDHGKKIEAWADALDDLDQSQMLWLDLLEPSAEESTWSSQARLATAFPIGTPAPPPTTACETRESDFVLATPALAKPRSHRVCECTSFAIAASTRADHPGPKRSPRRDAM